MAHTGAARAGVDNLTKSLAVEWAPKGVRVNAVAPGVIFSRSAAENYADPNMLVSMARGIPAQRLGTPEEVAAAVSFLLSPSASYITGTTLRVDGGSSLCGKLSDLPYHERMPPFAWPSCHC